MEIKQVKAYSTALASGPLKEMEMYWMEKVKSRYVIDIQMMK